MKVTMSRIITIEDAPIAKAIITKMKEDESTAAEYIKYAINAAYKGSRIEVFEASATIVKNRRVYDAYFEGSKDLDVWIDATAQTPDGFVIIGAYLTDIWTLNGDELASHMYKCVHAE